MNLSTLQERLLAADRPRPDAIKSVFEHLDGVVDAIGALRESGFRDLVVTSPLPRPDVEAAIYGGEPSPVRWFTLAGAIFGGIAGFSMASVTHLDWPMIIPAGKPLVSVPAFIVITFETTVMMGCLFTLVGLLVMCRLPAGRMQVEVRDPRFSDDRFGIVVNGVGRADVGRVRHILRTCGALEVSGMEVVHA